MNMIILYVFLAAESVFDILFSPSRLDFAVQENLDVMEKKGCQIWIQRPKNIRNDHTHQFCISNSFFCNAVLCLYITTRPLIQ